MTKGLIGEEDIAIINMYVPKIRAPKYIEQIFTDKKEEIDINTIILGDFNSHPTYINGQITQTENQ